MYVIHILPMLLALPSLYKCTFPITNDLARIEEFTGSSLGDCIQPAKRPASCPKFPEFRSLDGTCNNEEDPLKGAAVTPLIRVLRARYFDANKLDTPLGFPTILSFRRFATPQEVSSQLFKSAAIDGSQGDESLLFMVFGQFVDHDISITENREERFLPTCNFETSSFNDFKHPRFPMFNERDQTRGCTRFSRSTPLCQNSAQRSVRLLPNEITAFIDASQVYGSSEKELEELLQSNGYLLRVTSTANGDLLPTISQPKCFNNLCFLAGDIRSSEHVGLSTMHTIFLREHNRIARKLRSLNKFWSNKRVFDVTRKIVGAIFQKIVYTEYLPRLVTIAPYSGYKPNVNPGIIDGFSTAAFRYGHSLIKNSWTRLNSNFDRAADNVPLRETFFNTTILFNGGIEPFMFGLIGNNTNAIDGEFAEDILENLFTDLDPAFINLRENLIARNIHRGRDHGLRGYNRWRNFCKLSSAATFDDLTDIPAPKRTLLSQVYGNVRQIDLFAGGIIETPQNGNLVGPLFSCLIKQQFENIRDGDSFYFEREGVFTSRQLREIKKASLSRVLCDNLQGIVSIQPDPFATFARNKVRPSCDNFFKIPKLDLSVF